MIPGGSSLFGFVGSTSPWGGPGTGPSLLLRQPVLQSRSRDVVKIANGISPMEELVVNDYPERRRERRALRSCSIADQARDCGYGHGPGWSAAVLCSGRFGHDDRSGPISTTSIAGHHTLLCLAEQLCRRRRDCADRQAADGTGPCPPPLSSAKDRRTSGGRSPRLLDLWPRERHVFRPVRTLIDPRA
jgi:hypothetical protein